MSLGFWNSSIIPGFLGLETRVSGCRASGQIPDFQGYWDLRLRFRDVEISCFHLFRARGLSSVTSRFGLNRKTFPLTSPLKCVKIVTSYVKGCFAFRSLSVQAFGFHGLDVWEFGSRRPLRFPPSRRFGQQTVYVARLSFVRACLVMRICLRNLEVSEYCECLTRDHVGRMDYLSCYSGVTLMAS